MKLSPTEAMKLAIAEGKKGAGFVSPNPLVGCVILDRNGELISTGYHARYGEGHAEANALAKVKNPQQLEGAHVFVTLEPCAHEGKTPSCAKALAQLPVAAVTYGLEDPFELVSGQGAEILRQAGKSVTLFSGLNEELEELAEIFLLNQRHRRPFVALKVAASMDGKIAFEDGTSKWITNEASRAYVHELRGQYDAVLAGSGTFIKDDPRLNSRTPAFEKKPARAVILDPKGETAAKLPGSALWRARRPEDIFLVTAPGVPAPAGVQHLQCEVLDQSFDLAHVLDELYKRGVKSLFVEGGAHTYSGFLRAGLVDRLYLFTAPKIVGRGLSWTDALVLEDLSSALGLVHGRRLDFGSDSFFTARLT